MSNRLNFIVYALLDPRTDRPHYVGKACYGFGRARRHAVLAGVETTPKASWIRDLLTIGLMYKICILERCDSHEELTAAEERWIAAGDRLGWPLTNTAPDGTGRRGKMSAETRAKISAAKRGKPRPDLLGKPRPDLAEMNRTRPKSKETRAKLSAALIGHKRNVGRKMSAAHRKIMSDLRKQEWAADGWRRTDSPDGLRRNPNQIVKRHWRRQTASSDDLRGNPK